MARTKTRPELGEPLRDQDGRDVTGASLIIKGTGDGLSNALRTISRSFDVGTHLYIVLEARVEQIGYRLADSKVDPLEDLEAPLVRVHTARCIGATAVHETEVAALLEEVRAAARAAAEARKQTKGQLSTDDLDEE